MANSFGVPLSSWEITQFPIDDKAVSQELRIGLKNLNHGLGAWDAVTATSKISLSGT